MSWKWLSFILTAAFVQVAQGSGPLCDRRSPAKDVSALAKKSCEEVEKSAQCQSLYQMIRENGGDQALASRALNCSQQQGKNWVTSASDRLTGCLVGGVLAPSFDFIKGVVSDTQKRLDRLQEREKRNRECNTNLQQKEAIFRLYNQSVPKLLQVPMPSTATLQSLTCAKLESDLVMARLAKNRFVTLHVDSKSGQNPSRLTADEKEYLAWKAERSQEFAPTSNSSLLQLAQDKLAEMNLRLECYNPEAAWALSCEILYASATAFTGTVGTAKTLAGLAGVNSARLAVTAEKIAKHSSNLSNEVSSLKALSREERIAKAEKEIAPLSEEKKIEKLKSEMKIQDLSPDKLESLHQAHAAGSELGETYGTYSQATLKKKMDLLQKGGWSKEESEYLVLRGYAGHAADNSFVPLKTVTVKDPRLQAEVNRIYRYTDGAQADRLAASKINQGHGYNNGVAQNEQARQLFKSSGEKMQNELKTSTTGLSPRDEKSIINRVEIKIIEGDGPILSGRPDEISAWNSYERTIMSTQRKFEEAATMYIRAGDKDTAMKILDQSPVMRNLSSPGGRQNYLRRFQEEAQISVRPGP